jgi:hypothetical protein
VTSSKRQPPGIPIGGQFAAHGHAEPEVALVEPAAEPAKLEFDGSMVLRAARSVADRRRLSRSFRDDVVGETSFQVAKTVSNGETVGVPVELSPRYVAGVAQHVVARMTTLEQQSADRWAIGEYHRQLAASEQALKRMLSTHEEDALADAIRLGQPPRHRASPGFHRRNHMPVPLRRVDVVNASDPGPAPSDDFEEGSLGDRLLVDLEAGGTRAQAALSAWDALAERSGSPRVRRGVYRGRQYEATFESVRRSGGASAVAKEYLEGVAGKRAENKVDRLFEPFDATSPEQRRAVAMVIVGAGEYADDLWRSACRAASDSAPPT